MIQNIFLLFLGGGITFLFTFLYHRISERKPILRWRILPPVQLASQDLTALNINISNSGTLGAKNVRVIINVPEDSDISSLEVHPSESALTFKKREMESKHSAEILFPYFHSQIDCIISFLTNKIEMSAIHISIVGDDDVIGKIDTGISFEKLQKTRRRITLFANFYLLVLSLLVAFVFAWTIIVITNAQSNIEQIDVGDLYFHAGKYELALKKYGSIPDRWFMPPQRRILYKIAATYAALNKPNKSIKILRKISKGEQKDLAKFALIDPSFDRIKQSSEFQKFEKDISTQK